MTSVWLSRIENLDVGQPPAPYPSVLLLDRILGALGYNRDLERVLSERPWTRVAEGSEWAEVRPARRRGGRGGTSGAGAARRRGP